MNNEDDTRFDVRRAPHIEVKTDGTVAGSEVVLVGPGLGEGVPLSSCVVGFAGDGEHLRLPGRDPDDAIITLEVRGRVRRVPSTGLGGPALVKCEAER